MNKKIIAISIVVIIVLFSVTYFLFLKQEKITEIIPTKEYRVAYFGASTITPYWINLNNAFSEMTNKKGIVFEDFSGDLSIEDLPLLREISNQDFDAIIWGYGGTENLSNEAVQIFGEKGIPFFTFDNDVVSEYRNGFVGVSNYESSKLLGRYVYEKTSGVGNILVIVPNLVHEVAAERLNGFQDSLSSRGMNMKVINNDDLLWTTQRVYESVQNEFENDVEYAVIYTLWDEATLVARNYAESIGKNKNAIYIGFDGLQKMLQGISDEYVHVTVIQPTQEIAKETIEMAIKHLEGMEYEREILVPGIIVTIENVDEYL